MATAAQRALGTFEILERILLLLDRNSSKSQHRESAIEQLFTLQRVNCTFRNVIRNSIGIRRKMLLEHEEEPRPWPPMKTRTNNDCLDAGLRFLLATEDSPLYHHPLFPCVRGSVAHGQHCDLMYWHFSARNIPGHCVSACAHCIAAEIGFHSVTKKSFKNLEEAMEKFIAASSRGIFRPEASWRRMKICSQSPDQIDVRIDIRNGDEFCGSASVLDQNTVLGDVWDMISRIMHRTPEERQKLDKGYSRIVESFQIAIPEIDNNDSWNTEPETIQALSKVVREHGERYPCGRGGDGCAFCYVIDASNSNEVHSYLQENGIIDDDMEWELW